MFIHEAVKEAIEKGTCITRRDVEGEYSYRPTRIRLTNSFAGCIVYTFTARIGILQRRI